MPETKVFHDETGWFGLVNSRINHKTHTQSRTR